MSQDNWKNRSEGMRCKSCIWFVPKEDKAGTINLGRCRKHAPTMGGFPVMFVNDWCGEHRLDENSLIQEKSPQKNDYEQATYKVDVAKIERLKAAEDIKSGNPVYRNGNCIYNKHLYSSIDAVNEEYAPLTEEEKEEKEEDIKIGLTTDE